MFTIRSFEYTGADYAIMSVIDNAAFPEYPMSSAQWQHIDASRDPERLFQREIIERDGQPVAFGDYGHTPWWDHPDKYVMTLVIHPDHDDPLIRPLYLAHVLDRLAAHNPLALLSGALEDNEPMVRFLGESGFKPILREPQSVLTVETFDADRFAPVADQVRAAGIHIVSLAEWQPRDPEWRRKLYDLWWTLVPDVPSPMPHARQTFDEWTKATLETPTFTPDAWFLALDGDRYVGLSQGWVNPEDPEKFDNKLTGVIRSHRRRGIATALKLRLIDYARRQGAKTIITGNEEHNPMYNLNLKLGFVPKPAWVMYEKGLRAT